MTTPNDLAAQAAAIAAASSLVSAAGGSLVGLPDRLIASANSIGAPGGYIAFGRSFGQGSATGIFVDQLTVREDHRDEMVITEHPVAVGQGPSPVSDHAYVRPAEVVLDCQWSNAGHGPTYASDVYARLLRLRNERRLFSVATGKRSYVSMLMAGIDATTDESTEFALRATLHLRQVITTRVQNFSVSADPSVQSNPTQTQPGTDLGSQQTYSGGFPGGKSSWDDTKVATQAASGQVSYEFKDASGTSYTGPVKIPVTTQPDFLGTTDQL